MGLVRNVFALIVIVTIWNAIITNSAVSTKTNPNILFFLTDDWGFNDVGYYENTDTTTPFIDGLVAEESLRIDKFYVLPECTITRCALLTGRHPMRYGMQDGILQFQSAYALSRHETLISNEFQDQGYKTWLVGKWHVGMRNWDYTPTYRGFDHFLGYYGGLINYYDHYGQNKYYKSSVDFRWDETEYEEEDTYTLYTYTERVLQLLDSFSTEEKEAEMKNEENSPFFMYVAWQGSHSPSEAPDDYADMYSSSAREDNDYRQYFQAQTTLTDDLFKEIVEKLKDTGLWDNTLVIFASDNGGSIDFGDNAPLRGAKFTIWEGGIRVPAFITGGVLPSETKGKVLDQFPVHVTDWYATLLDAAGLEVTTSNELDGKNMWPLIINSNDIVTDDESGRVSLDASSVLKEDEVLDGQVTDDMVSELADDRYILINVNSASCETEVCGAIIYGGRWKVMVTSNQIVQNNMDATAFWLRNFASGEEDVLGCNEIPDDVATQTVGNENPMCYDQVCLFDLLNDPCEYYDVSDKYPEVADKLYTKLKEYSDEQIPPLNDMYDWVESDDIDPTDTGFWHPWDDSEWSDVDFEVFLSQYYNGEVDTSVVITNKNKNKNKNNENLGNLNDNFHGKERIEANIGGIMPEGEVKNSLFGFSDGQFFGLIVSAFLMLAVCGAYISRKRSDGVYKRLIERENFEEIPLAETNYNSVAL